MSIIQGKRIAFTGAFYNMSRKEATQKALAVGATVSPVFSPKNCDFLVTGGAAAEGSTKSKNALQAGTQVIAESAFFQAIGMPVPQYDPATFKQAAKGRAKAPTYDAVPKADLSNAFGVRAPTKRGRKPKAAMTPTMAMPEPQAETAVEADGTLTEQQTEQQAPVAEMQPPAVPQPVNQQEPPASVVDPAAVAAASPDVAPKTRRPRGPRVQHPVITGIPAAPIEMTADGTILLSGKTVVFTGRLENLNRLTAATLVHKMGGNVSGSVSSKTDLLVCGASAGLKRNAAAKKGIATISEDDFIAACANAHVAAPTPVMTPQ